MITTIGIPRNQATIPFIEQLSSQYGADAPGYFQQWMGNSGWGIAEAVPRKDHIIGGI